MKKISILFSLLLCFSFNVYAGTIYCFSANKGNELLKSTIPTNLIESDQLKYFKIDDKKTFIIIEFSVLRTLKYYFSSKFRIYITN